MINAVHVLLYSTDAEADREFFRAILGLRAVDAGEGWLIFELPPAELAVHPGDGAFVQRHAGRSMAGALLYFMCDSLEPVIAALAAGGVACSPVEAAPWGLATTIRLPSGASIGLYEPRHPLAVRPA